MKTKFISISVLVALMALLFSGCINAADDTTNKNTGNSDGKENTGKPPINDDEIEAPAPLITWEQNNFSIVNADDTVEVGTEAVVFTFPGTDDEFWGDTGWALSFVSGTGDTHNNKFSIGEGDNKNKILVKEELPLSVYNIRVEINGSENGVNTYSSGARRFIFTVTQTPAEFVKAPSVLPHIVAGGNKLEVSWQAQQGAAGYKVYINKVNNSANAIELPEITGRSNTSIDITHYPGEENKLPDGTDYYVWVKAFNAFGETKISPVTKQHTSDPIEAWFYTGNTADLNVYYPAYKDTADGMGWDSGYDWYIIVPDREGKGVHFQYFGGTSGDGFNNDSLILYHRRFDPVEMEEKSRFYCPTPGQDLYWDIGHSLLGKTNFYLSVPQAISTGLAGSLSVQNLPAAAKARVLGAGYPADGIIPPSGVFIIKNTAANSEQYPYYATFYHGMAARAPSGNLLIYFGNAAGSLGASGRSTSNPPGLSTYSSTFEHALSQYTVDNYNYFIAYVAVAWCAREIQFLGCGPGRHGWSDTNEGYIPYP